MIGYKLDFGMPDHILPNGRVAYRINQKLVEIERDRLRGLGLSPSGSPPIREDDDDEPIEIWVKGYDDLRCALCRTEYASGFGGSSEIRVHKDDSFTGLSFRLRVCKACIDRAIEPLQQDYTARQVAGQVRG